MAERPGVLRRLYLTALVFVVFAAFLMLNGNLYSLEDVTNFIKPKRFNTDFFKYKSHSNGFCLFNSLIKIKILFLSV